MPRFLEGELVEYNGVLWVVKGFQHPRGFVIAYPRYNLNTIPASKTVLLPVETLYWDCIGREVPLIPVDKVLPYTPRTDYLARELSRLIAEASGVDLDSIYCTGSRATGFTLGDIDLVVYGSRNTVKAYKALLDLREEGVLKPLKGAHLIREYEKHREVSIEEYSVLRENSVLQGVYKNTRYSIRLVPYTRGYMECVEPAKPVGYYTGLIEIVGTISPYTTPAYYRVKLVGRGEVVLMMTFRLKYTELPKGMLLHVKKGVIEETRDSIRLVPDHGFLKPVISTKE